MGIELVEVIVAGPQGVPGTPGASTHPGGTTTQVLAKKTNTDYDVEWIDVDSSNVVFTSGEGLVSTDAGAAIDEVEAARKVNSDDIVVLTERGEIDLSLTTEDIDSITAPGIYDVTDANNLPFSLTTARLSIIKEISGGTDVVEQILTSTSNSKEYYRVKIGIAAWGAWAEKDISSRISTISTQLEVVSKASIDIDTIVTPGLYTVDTNLPSPIISGELSITKNNGSTPITQLLKDTSSAEVFTRTSALGNGTDWTAWTQEALSAQVIANLESINVLEAPAPYADMEPQAVPVPYTEGRFYYNSVSKTFNLMGPFEGLEVQPGHGNHLHIINNSGSTITAGMAVRAAGVSGGKIQVTPAIATSFDNARVIGMAVIDIPNGSESAIATDGLVTNINTNGLSTGTPMFLSDTIAGTYTSVAPAIRTVVGGVIVADATTGVVRLDITANQNIPTVLGRLKGQSTGGVYSLTTIAQDIINYSLEKEVVATANTTTGKITVANSGEYNTIITSSISFTSTTSTRTVSVEVYNETTATVEYTYNKNIPRDATLDSFGFNWPISATAGNVYKLRVKSNTPMGITIADISFSLVSTSLT